MTYFILAKGFEEVEALAPIDILRRGGVEVKIASLDGKKTIEGAHGIEVTADIPAKKIKDDIDLIVFPGRMPGTKNLDESALTDSLIEKAIEKGARIAAICAAPMILGKRGLLKGKSATCFPGFEKYLEGAEVSDCAAITDGLITTGKGMIYALDFGRELLMQMTNKENADKVMSLPARK